MDRYRLSWTMWTEIQPDCSDNPELFQLIYFCFLNLIRERCEGIFVSCLPPLHPVYLCQSFFFFFTRADHKSPLAFHKRERTH